MTNPRFPQGYPIINGQYNYDANPSSRLTIKQQMQRQTFANMHPEAQRCFVFMQILIAVRTNGIVLLGVGTGERLDNPEVASGKSWHNPIPYDRVNRKNAMAVDAVGYPTHDAAWWEMQKVANACGWASFQKGTTQFNYTGKPANVSNDPPHVQLYMLPYSRPAAIMPIPNVGHLDIPRQWDIASPLFNWDNPIPELDPPFVPPAPPMPNLIDNPNFGGSTVINGIFSCNGMTCATYDGGYKIWLQDPEVVNQVIGLAALSGKTLREQATDILTWVSLGPLVGPRPDNYDGWGVLR